MKVLVSGVSGFVGPHVVRELKKRGHQVMGVGREAQPKAEIKVLLDNYDQCDLTNPNEVANLPLDEIDAVINLAGLANVGASFRDPDTYNQVNVDVLRVMGKQLADQKSPARVLAISTGAVYQPNQPMPLKETSDITMEGSPYAQSKLLMEQAAQQLRQDGLDCVIVRPFNHIGPGQEPGFLVPDLYHKIEQALKTNQPVEVGDLTTKRDYTDVRDVARAYADLIEQPNLKFDIYNVCSSKSIAGQEILDELLGLMNAAGKVEIKLNQAFIRPNDPKDLYGSYERLSQATNWRPQSNLSQALKDFIDSKN